MAFSRHMTKPGAVLLACAAIVFCAAIAQAEDTVPKRSVAITFDDLPHADAGTRRAPSPDAIRDQNRRVIEVLRKHAAPAIGFVVERNVEATGPLARDVLKDWTGPDLTLGNHLFSHADTNKLGMAGIEREIVDGGRSIGPLLDASGETGRFLRFPFNHLGDTSEKQAAIAGLADRLGYTIAAATIDTSDYVFDRAYGKALSADDGAMAARIRSAYLDHTKGQIAYYAGLDRQALGREPPAIMLLHLNRLNADTLDDILTVFEHAGYGFVSLAEAQSDPAYRKLPSFATPFGPMWGYRWARDNEVKIDASLEKEPPAWVVNYGKGGG